MPSVLHRIDALDRLFRELIDLSAKERVHQELIGQLADGAS